MKRRAFVRSTLAAVVGTSLPVVPRFTAYPHAAQDPPDIDAVTGDGRQVTLRGRAVAQLAKRLSGRILLRTDEGYDDARRILNPSFDKYPALIAQVTGTADVRAAVEFAREHNLLTAVKCGGHSASGKSTCDRGIMIDLSPFRSVTVDPVARRAWVTGGSLLGQIDHEAMVYDLVTPVGTVSHTGVGGLVTGGGFGRVARRFGMSIDNLTGVHVIAADGSFHRANAEENADLFWAVRGGGGNFGIVTSFEFQLHPMQRQVLGGNMIFPIDRARDVLNAFGEYLPHCPPELDLGFFVIHPPRVIRRHENLSVWELVGPEGRPGAAGFSVCYSGPPAGADRALAPLRALGTPLVDVQPIDYLALQRSGDTDDPRARASYLKSGFVPEVSGSLVGALIDHLEAHPGRNTGIAFQPGGGVIRNVGNGDTAFAHRDAAGNLLGFVDWPSGTDPSEHTAWIQRFWSNVEPFTQGFYVNDGDPEATQEVTNANYGQNYRRLVQVKNRYDPTNLFRLNSNVIPSA